MSELMTAGQLEAALRQIGAERYHSNHLFHKLLHGGRLSKGQVQAWALNRYYYQARIPIKDATIVARMEDPALRRAWCQRIADRVQGMLANYDFVTTPTLAYFDKRLTQAPRDADFALDYVKREALRADQQQAVLDALIFKCDVLWAQLDALYAAYVEPGMIPPGAFRPEAS